MIVLECLDDEWYGKIIGDDLKWSTAPCMCTVHCCYSEGDLGFWILKPVVFVFKKKTQVFLEARS